MSNAILSWKGQRQRNQRRNRMWEKRVEEMEKNGLCASLSVNLSDTGCIEYYSNFFNDSIADNILKSLLNVDYDRPKYFDFRGNKYIYQPRESMWFGPCKYNYSKYILDNYSFTDSRWGFLENIRRDMCRVFKYNLNSCLINVYRDGQDSVGWHADDEPIFGTDPNIVSLSFGQTRKFKICRKSDRRGIRSFPLDHGSVIVMKGDMQRNWLHCVPKVLDSKCDVRINLTFRTVI